jgi:ribosomal protein L40E
LYVLHSTLVITWGKHTAVFKGESDDPCPKFKSAAQVVKVEVQPPQASEKEAVLVQRSPLEAVSNSPDESQPEVSETKIPIIPFIVCVHCKAQNPPERLPCSQCRADLLPGEGFLMRQGYLIGGIIVAVLFVWLAVSLFKNRNENNGW